MEKQNCKVGSVKAIAADNSTITLLEYQYQHFLDKAANMKYTDARLVEFFESKTQKIQKILENLIK